MKVIGIGNTAEVFEHDADKVCKLFNEGYPKEYVELEFNNALILNKMDFPVPKVYDIIEKDNRTGIVYERIYGKSLMKAILEGENVEKLFQLFIQLQQEILHHHSAELVSYKDFMIGSLKGKACADDVLIGKIVALPEGDCVCHGDFHPGNIILKPDNSAVVIDFMNVCRGRREYDIARTYFLLDEFSKNIADNLGGISISDVYLEQMNVRYEDIEKWVEVILEYLKYEKNNCDI